MFVVKNDWVFVILCPAELDEGFCDLTRDGIFRSNRKIKMTEVLVSLAFGFGDKGTKRIFFFWFVFIDIENFIDIVG